MNLIYLHRKVILFIWLLQLMLAFIIAFNFYQFLDSGLSHSLNLQKLLHHYHHNTLMDLLRTHHDEFNTLIKTINRILIISLLLSVFTNTILLVTLRQNGPNFFLSIIKKAFGLYFAFFTIGLLFILFTLIPAGILLFPLLRNLESLMQNLSSEKYAIWLLLFGILISFCIGIYFHVCSILSKFNYLQLSSLSRSIRQSFKNTQANKAAIFSNVAAFIIFQILLFVFFHSLLYFIPNHNWMGLLFVFIAQQFWLILKISAQLIFYHRMYSYSV